MLLAYRISRGLRLPGIRDHLIHLGVSAEEAISKGKSMRTRLGSLLGTFCIMVHADFPDTAILDGT
jgi:hypothetical protein